MSEKPKSQDASSDVKPASEVESYLFPSLAGSFAAGSDYTLTSNQNGEGSSPYGLNPSSRLYQSHYDDPWTKEELQTKGEPLYASFGGRVGIRMFSRGIVGITAGTIADLVMRDYDPVFMRKAQQMVKEGNVETYESIPLMHKGVDYIVRGIDATLKPLIQEGIARPLGYLKGKEGEELENFVFNSTRFKTKINSSSNSLAEAREVMQDYYATKHGGERKYDEGSYREWLKTLPEEKLKKLDVRQLNGRDLGHEIVDVTFGFAAMSVGDALGRNLVGVFDPNVKKDWLNKDGSIDIPKLGKSSLDAAIDIMTYRQGEDWAVALPYVYTMRALRAGQSKAHENVKFTLDNNNGSVFVADAKTGDISGDTLKSSALNFQSRFMFYNFYTSMFRDAYQNVLHKIHDVDADKSQDILSQKKHESVLGEVGSDIREAIDYTAVSFIKSMTWMAPVVPFFWAPRIALSRSNARAIYNNLPLENGQTGMGVVTSSPATPIISTGPNWESEEQVFGRNGHTPVSKYEREFYATPSMVVTRGAPATYISDVAEGIKPFNQTKQGWYALPYSNYLSDTDKAYTERMQAYAGSKRLHGSEFTVNFDSLAARKNDDYINFIINPIAKIGRFVTNGIDKGLIQGVLGLTPERVAESGDMTKYFFKDTSDLSRRLVSHSLSYTGYFIAKYEAETHINNAATDASLYLAMDGIWNADLNKIKTGFTDYAHVITKHPISEQTYEKMYEGKGLVNSKQREEDLKHNFEQGVTLPTTAHTVQRHKDIGHKPAISISKRIGYDSNSLADLNIANSTIATRDAERTPLMPKEHSFVQTLLESRNNNDIEQGKSNASEAGEGSHAQKLNERVKGTQSWKDMQLQRAAQDLAQNNGNGATIH